MKRVITPCTSRGSVAANVQSALQELKTIAAAVRRGRIANTIAATTGLAAADVAQLLGVALAQIEAGLGNEDPKARRRACRLLRNFQKLVEIESLIARCDRLLLRAKVAGGRGSKKVTKNGLKRWANSGGPHAG